MKQKIDNWISNIVLIVSLAFLSLVGINIVIARQTGSQGFICGYRPIYVMTGSMEPTMLTNSFAMTKQVKSIDELAVGDIITFRVYDELAQRELTITHRIIDISDDEVIQTQGDNNDAPDNFSLTIDNVQSKVIGVWNGFARCYHFFNSKYGIPTTIALFAAFVLACIAVKCLKPDGDDKRTDSPHTKQPNGCENTDNAEDNENFEVRL